MLVLFALFLAAFAGFDQAQINEILAKHNADRRTYGVPDLVWDATVASVAQRYADTCPTGHSTSKYGENLAWSSNRPTYEQWQSERNTWRCSMSSYGTSTTGNIYDCLHWTQIIDKRSTKLGCGHNTCSGRGNGMQALVCNYDPPGNFNINSATPVNTCSANNNPVPVPVAPVPRPVPVPVPVPRPVPVPIPVPIPVPVPVPRPVPVPVPVPVAAPVPTGAAITSISVTNNRIPQNQVFTVTVGYQSVQAGSKVTVEVYDTNGWVLYGFGDVDVNSVGSASVPVTVSIGVNDIPIVSTVQLKAWIVGPSNAGKWRSATGAATGYQPVSVGAAPVPVPVPVPVPQPIPVPIPVPVPVPVAVPVASGPGFVACYQDNNSGNRLGARGYSWSTGPITPATCTSTCGSRGFPFYGLSKGTEQGYSVNYCNCYATQPTAPTADICGCGLSYQCGAANAIAFYRV